LVEGGDGTIPSRDGPGTNSCDPILVKADPVNGNSTILATDLFDGSGVATRRKRSTPKVVLS